MDELKKVLGHIDNALGELEYVDDSYEVRVDLDVVREQVIDLAQKQIEPNLQAIEEAVSMYRRGNYDASSLSYMLSTIGDYVGELEEIDNFLRD